MTERVCLRLHSIAIALLYTLISSDTLSISILFSQYHPSWRICWHCCAPNPTSVGPNGWGLAIYILLMNCRGGWAKLICFCLSVLTIKGEAGEAFLKIFNYWFLFFLTPLRRRQVPQKLIYSRAPWARFLVIFSTPPALPISIFKGFSNFFKNFYKK